MARRIESLFIQGPAGKLEALIEPPEDREPSQAVLVCHPHPQHGGTMHNKVVYRIARAMRRTGAVVLRFNYRGVNMSEGVYDNGIGEMEDAKAASNLLRSRFPRLPLSLAGFSFGAKIVLRLGCEVPGIQRVIAVGFAAGHPGSAEVGRCDTPKTFIQSTNDEFCATGVLEAYVAALSGPKELIWIEARDHFFAGSLDQFEEAVYGSAS